MVYQGVVDTATGDLLRAGFCDFKKDGSFDAATQTMRNDVPYPGLVRGDAKTTQMHRWDEPGQQWVVVPQS